MEGGHTRAVDKRAQVDRSTHRLGDGMAHLCSWMSSLESF